MEKLKNLNVTTVIIMQLFLSQVGNLEKLLCVKSKSCEICSFKIHTEKKQKLTTKIFMIRSTDGNMSHGMFRCFVSYDIR